MPSPATVGTRCPPGARHTIAAALCSALFLIATLGVSAIGGHSVGVSAVRTVAHTSAFPKLLYVTEDAVVTGAVSAKAQAAFEAAEGGWGLGRRSLLHGNRRPKNYSRCPSCTLITCAANDGTNFNSACSGHCRTTQRLFTCRASGAVADGCFDPDPPDPFTLPADSLEPGRSVRVDVPEPFIGCANITGLPNGCPANGNAGTRADGTSYSVLWTTCRQHLYTQECGGGETGSPFHPFGYCMCTVFTDAGRVQQAPCSLAELDGYSGPPLSDTGDVPIRIVTERGTSITTFGERDELDLRPFTYNHTFDERGTAVLAYISLYERRIQISDDLTAEGPL